MAAVSAEASISGGSSVSVAARMGLRFTSSVAGDTSISASLGGSFTGSASMVGDAVASLNATIEARVSAALSGDAVLTPPAFSFLIEANLSGNSAVVASAELALAAVAGLSGDADVAADVDMALAAVASPSGESVLTADALMDNLAAVATLAGDAAFSATALPIDELSGDLIGASTVAAAPVSAYAAVASATGGSNIVAVAKVRLPTPEQLLVPEATVVPPERFIGYQPGREPAIQSNALTIDASPPAQTLIERLSSGLHINSASEDAAGLAVQNKLASKGILVAAVVGGATRGTISDDDDDDVEP